MRNDEATASHFSNNKISRLGLTTRSQFHIPLGTTVTDPRNVLLIAAFPVFNMDTLTDVEIDVRIACSIDHRTATEATAPQQAYGNHTDDGCGQQLPFNH